MTQTNGPILDMTRGGDFVEPPKPSLGKILGRVAAFGVVLLFAALAFWVALFMIPVLLVLGVVGYFVARHQMKQGRFTMMRRF